MSLFVIIVAAILTAAWLFQNPDVLRSIFIWLFGLFAFLFILVVINETLGK